MNKTLKEFLEEYTAEMLKLMTSHSHSLSAMSLNCSACPFRELCHEDESGTPCEEFILSLLTDGKEYKAK